MEEEWFISCTLTDSVITDAMKTEQRNQAVVTPDHCPASTAFTNDIKAPLVTAMPQRTRGGKKTLSKESKMGDSTPALN